MRIIKALVNGTNQRAVNLIPEAAEAGGKLDQGTKKSLAESSKTQVRLRSWARVWQDDLIHQINIPPSSIHIT